MSDKIYLFSIASYPKAIHVNSLDVHLFKPEIDFAQYDYLIITSKQASQALQQYNSIDYLDKKAVAISQRSAKSYEQIGGKILEIGKGYGDNLYELIKSYPKDKRWLYLRAKEVASDFAKKAQEEALFIDEAVVYETQCSKEIMNVSVENDATLIFTSPSSVKCFLKYHRISKHNRVIVIGKTTAKALPLNVDFFKAQEPTIKSCFALL